MMIDLVDPAGFFSGGWFNWLAAFVGWVGHGFWLTGVLNRLYACALPKSILRPARYFTGLLVLLYPLLLPAAGVAPDWVRAYFVATLLVGGVAVPVDAFLRRVRPRPSTLVAETTETLDYWPRLGRVAIGDGIMAWAPRLPGSDVFKVDFSIITLAFPDIPVAWDQVEILLISDVHFHGTPARVFFDAVFEKLAAELPPDLVVFAGDTLDSDEHLSWIQPLFRQLRGTTAQVAVLGNHDLPHHPDRIRAELQAAGFTVLGNGWHQVMLRGEPLAIVGHEGPWFGPPPDAKAAPAGFRLLVSHTPDNLPWAADNGIRLMLAGHVHGGQIRVPVLGPIFVPSRFGRWYADGIFERGPTTLVVNRGLSGKEPLRFRCRPQVCRVRLQVAANPAS